MNVDARSNKAVSFPLLGLGIEIIALGAELRGQRPLVDALVGVSWLFDICGKRVLLIKGLHLQP